MITRVIIPVKKDTVDQEGLEVTPYAPNPGLGLVFDGAYSVVSDAVGKNVGDDGGQELAGVGPKFCENIFESKQ